MEWPSAFFIMLSLAMFALTLEARPDPGVSQSLAHKKPHCDTPTNNELSVNQNLIKIEKKNPFVEDFEPRPNVSSYNDDSEVKNDKSFVKDFEPRPTFWIYDDVNSKVKGNEKSFVKDFEPRPNVSAYGEDKSLKGEKMFVNDFEPRPNVSAYSEDTNLKGEKTFVNDFEPRPNVSVYND